MNTKKIHFALLVSLLTGVAGLGGYAQAGAYSKDGTRGLDIKPELLYLSQSKQVNKESGDDVPAFLGGGKKAKKQFKPGGEANASDNQGNQNRSVKRPVELNEQAEKTGSGQDSGNQKGNENNDSQKKSSGNQDVKFFDENPGIGQVLSEKEYLKKIDPETQPGQKFLVVEKNAERDDQDALLEAARRAREYDRYEAALRFYNQLQKLNPDDKVINLERAITLHKLGRYGSALKAYDKVLDMDPDNIQARINMLVLVRNKYPAVALEKMKKLYEENPGNAALAAQIGVLLAGQKEYESARDYLDSAISLEPGNPNHYYNLAIVHDMTGNFVKAVSLYEEALEIDAVKTGFNKIPREKIYDRLSILRDRI